MSGRSAEEEAHEKERDGAAPRGRVALAGGGTAGHVFPALAVGEALAHRGWSLTFYGSPSGFEARIVPARGVPFVALAARPFLGRGPIAKLGAALTLVRSAFAARRSLRGEGTAVLVATGGYVAAPVLAGARLARIPFLLVEPNARAGAANRHGTASNRDSTR